MKTQIKDIANIRTGIFLKPKSPLKAELAYLQVSHFNDHGYLKRYVKPEVSESLVNPIHILSPGEVLFSAKGLKNFATVYKSEFPKSVASSSFLVLTVHLNKVMPEYLVWFLNSPEIQIKLKQEALGTSIQSISKSSLEELMIPIPSIKAQEKILAIGSLCAKANFLRDEISKRETKMYNDQIFKFLNRNHEN